MQRHVETSFPRGHPPPNPRPRPHDSTPALCCLYPQVTVLQGSVDVLTRQLEHAKADLASARQQQLADALAAQTLARKVCVCACVLPAGVSVAVSWGGVVL